MFFVAKAIAGFRVLPTAFSRIAFYASLAEGSAVNATEIIAQIKALTPEEFAKVSAFMSGEESPEMLAAIDEGLRSLDQNKGTIQTRAELQEKVRRWAGVSR